MRVPIQREASGRLSIVIDFENTPLGFEDMFEDSLFYRRYSQTQAMGEFSTPAIDTLAGNPNAQLYRLRTFDENRICFTMIHMNHTGRYLHIEIRPYGPMGNTMRNLVVNSPTQPFYVTFRLEHTTDDNDELKVTQISGADFTTD